MNNATLAPFAEKLVQVLFSDKVIPAQVLTEIGDLVSEGDPGYQTTLRNVWSQQNQARQQAGGSPRTIDLPLYLTGGFDQDTAEEELGRFLPEEKILINKEIFRQKLKSVDFSALDARREQSLLEELRNDAIGLSREETVFYYNLIKINALSGSIRQRPSAPVETIDFPGTILDLAESNLLMTPANIAKLNLGRFVPREKIKNILTVSIKNNRINPKVLALLLGYRTDKYLRKLIRFFEMIVGQRGENAEEVIQYFAFYLLAHTADETLLKTLELTSPLYSFLTNKIGRVREIYYVSMLFAITFFIVLLSQISEIAGKFQDSSDDQKSKLLKLYQSDERIAMLVQNAVNLATRRIAEFKVESREVLSNLKRFLAANPDLVTSADLFKTDYRMEGKK
jgi:hypothetical protein